MLQEVEAAGLLGAGASVLPGGGTFAVSASELWHLAPVPLLQQARMAAFPHQSHVRYINVRIHIEIYVTISYVHVQVQS